MEKPKAMFAITVDAAAENPLAKIYVIGVLVDGDRQQLIDAIAGAMVTRVNVREIINAAGKLANKIRRGEEPMPDFSNIHNN